MLGANSVSECTFGKSALMSTYARSNDGVSNCQATFGRYGICPVQTKGAIICPRRLQQ
jgi:hypothetical protein